MGAWVSSLFGSERNSFDRVMHLAFGLLVLVPMAEFLEAAFGLARRTALVFSIVWLTAMGAVYEIIEWSSMLSLDSDAAAMFVGLQGDPWDAQKDMALALLGSIVAYVHVRTWRRFVTAR